MSVGSKVSIIIPVFQSEKYLAECLTSILNQTYNNLQIIIIDDGSNDNSPTICDMFAEKDKRVQVIHKNNEGVSVARNIGLFITEGEYVSFVDSDDWVEKNYIEILLNAIQEKSADLVFCDYYEYQGKQIERQYFNYRDIHIFTNANCKKKESINYLQKSFLYPRLAPMYNSNYTIGVPWGKLYKTSLLKDNIFDQNLALNEDVIFNIKAFGSADRVVYIPKPLYYYRIFDESSMKKIDSNIYKAISIRVQLISKYQELQSLTNLKKAIIGKQGTLVIQCMQLVRELKDDFEIKDKVYSLAKKIMIKCHGLPRLRAEIMYNYLIKCKQK